MIFRILVLLLMVRAALTNSADVSAQTGGKVHRLGWVSFFPVPTQPTPLPRTYEVIKARLAEREDVEGKNVTFEPRWADGSFERVPGLFAELERSGVDVIYAPGSQMARIGQNLVKRTPLVVCTHVIPSTTSRAWLDRTEIDRQGARPDIPASLLQRADQVIE